MFRAVRRSSSGALTVFAASGLHTHVVTGRSQVRVGTVSTQT
jgi:dolichol kinase